MQKSINNIPVLVLNRSYEPISICSARRALTLLIKGAARVEEEHDYFVWKTMRMPSVIRLENYAKVPRVRQQVTRRNIFTRDQFTCQYCEKKLPANQLTVDHVFPKSRGGPESWENLVACCYPCNRRKANRTPDEANMTLLREPRAVTLHTTRALMRAAALDDAKWRKHLYYD
jgi:5-methylcytosine-specific restriction endonuclease McrA